MAQGESIERNRDEALDEAVARHLNTYRSEERLRRQWAAMTPVDLAQAIAEQMGLYDKEQEGTPVARPFSGSGMDPSTWPCRR